MHPNVHHLHSIQHPGCEQPSADAGHGVTISAMPGVVESCSDQTWTEFCASLSRNAFLLADNGFGGLEQS